jgi:murein DD-endopeptidase MepM/ murein hydrolase activator NlpD
LKDFDFLPKFKNVKIKFIILLCILPYLIWANQFDGSIKEIQNIPEIQDLKNDPNLNLLREEVKYHLRQSQKNIDLKIYQYRLKKNEDFYYLMAKTYMDHSSLLSLNQIKIEDFKPNTVIYLPNCRGYFTEKALNQPTNYRIVIASLKKSFYFYPHQKDLMVFQKQFSEPNHTTKKYLFPLPTKNNIITSPYGWRIDPFTNKKAFHPGIDIQAEYKTPVYAPFDGKVIFSGFKKGYGKTIIIENQNEQFLLAHLAVLHVKVNDSVKAGDLIGLTGKTGRTTGPHLHLEYLFDSKWKNPMLIFRDYFSSRNE